MEEQLKLWRQYLKAKSQSEKEAILKKICPGITSEGLEIMKREMPVPGEKDEPEKNNILTQEEISGVLSGRVSVAEILGLSEEEVESNMARGDEGKLGDD